MNAILMIHPYRSEGVWVFDDARVGLVKEPFVAGADTILDRMVEGIPQAAHGVTVLFSAARFPGSRHELERRREEFGGNWYFSPEFGIEGWLCPALFRYFEPRPRAHFRPGQAQGGRTALMTSQMETKTPLSGGSVPIHERWSRSSEASRPAITRLRRRDGSLVGLPLSCVPHGPRRDQTALRDQPRFHSRKTDCDAGGAASQKPLRAARTSIQRGDRSP